MNTVHIITILPGDHLIPVPYKLTKSDEQRK